MKQIIKNTLGTYNNEDEKNKEILNSRDSETVNARVVYFSVY